MANGTLNRVIFIGNVGRDPKVSNVNGLAIAKVMIATTELGKDKEKKTDWHTITFFSKLAELAEKFITKGMKIAVEGKIKQEKWKNKEGKMCYGTTIIADRLEFLGNTKHEVEELDEVVDLPDLDIPF